MSELTIMAIQQALEYSGGVLMGEQRVLTSEQRAVMARMLALVAMCCTNSDVESPTLQLMDSLRTLYMQAY